MYVYMEASINGGFSIAMFESILCSMHTNLWTPQQESNFNENQRGPATKSCALSLMLTTYKVDFPSCKMWKTGLQTIVW